MKCPLEATAVMNAHKINKMFEFIILDIFLFLCCQDDKDLVHEFVVAEGLTCLIKVGAEADQNYQNYILRGMYAAERAPPHLNFTTQGCY